MAEEDQVNLQDSERELPPEQPGGAQDPDAAHLSQHINPIPGEGDAQHTPGVVPGEAPTDV